MPEVVQSYDIKMFQGRDGPAIGLVIRIQDEAAVYFCIFPELNDVKNCVDQGLAHGRGGIRIIGVFSLGEFMEIIPDLVVREFDFFIRQPRMRFESFGNGLFNAV